jgi:hypothetical protein
MDFYAVHDQTIDLLRQCHRVTYRNHVPDGASGADGDAGLDHDCLGCLDEILLIQPIPLVGMGAHFL